MDKIQKSSLLLLLGGSSVLSAVGYGFYSVCKKLLQNKLSPWLEEYIREVKEKIKVENKLSIESIVSIFNLITEIEEYLYNKQYCHVEGTRVKLLKTRDYENAVMQTVEFHESTMNRANKIIEQRLNVTINDLREALESHGDKAQVRSLLETTKKLYNEGQLPKVDKEILKKAYLYYASQLGQLDKVDKNNMNLVQLRPEFKELTLHIYFLNKYIVKDTIKSTYGIDEKYFTQLLTLHDLMEDPEVKAVRSEIKNL